MSLREFLSWSVPFTLVSRSVVCYVIGMLIWVTALRQVTAHAHHGVEAMYKHILIPTDGSKLSSRAVQQGRGDRARRGGAGDRRCSSRRRPTPLLFKGRGAGAPHAARGARQRSRAKAAARYLGEIEAAAQAAGVPCECVSIEGEFPAEAILQASQPSASAI